MEKRASQTSLMVVGFKPLLVYLTCLDEVMNRFYGFEKKVFIVAFSSYISRCLFFLEKV
jgi:hypothetical protein